MTTTEQITPSEGRWGSCPHGIAVVRANNNSIINHSIARVTAVGKNEISLV